MKTWVWRTAECLIILTVLAAIYYEDTKYTRLQADNSTEIKRMNQIVDEATAKIALQNTFMMNEFIDENEELATLHDPKVNVIAHKHVVRVQNYLNSEALQ